MSSSAHSSSFVKTADDCCVSGVELIHLEGVRPSLFIRTSDILNPMIKAVFFDLDETLIDASKCHSEADKRTFEHFGLNNEEIKRTTRQHNFWGVRIIDILRIKRDAAGLSEVQLPLQKLEKVRQDIFLKLVKQKAKLLPGASSAIKNSKQNLQYVAIVSSGTRRYINLVLTKFNLNKYIDYIVSGEDVKKGKPDPECYEKAYSLLLDKSILKSECLVVEDALNGIKAAKAAQMKVLYIPYSGNKEKIDVGVDWQLDSLEDFSSLSII